MIQFIKNNKYIISIVLGFVAVALSLSYLVNAYDAFDTYSDYEYADSETKFQLLFNIFKGCAVVVASLLFIILGYRRIMDKGLIIAALVCYGLLDILDLIVEIRNSTFDYTCILSIAIDVLILVIGILALTDRKYFFTIFIVFLIDMAFNLLETFTGSTIGFALLILGAMLIGAIYLYNQEDNSSDYNYYN
ncbi:MAG: hypothetical protein K6G48_07535 [Acholeplasmatales bacterium]|nr:hypothetical protein [Acholeplasmatales bacterium]